jgi:hypothetical protein
LVFAAFFACFAFGVAGSLVAAALSRCFLVGTVVTLSCAAASTATIARHRVLALGLVADPDVGRRLAQPGADETDLVSKTTKLLGGASLLALARLQLLSQPVELVREVLPRVVRLAEP